MFSNIVVGLSIEAKNDGRDSKAASGWGPVIQQLAARGAGFFAGKGIANEVIDKKNGDKN